MRRCTHSTTAMRLTSYLQSHPEGTNPSRPARTSAGHVRSSEERSLQTSWKVVHASADRSHHLRHQ